MNEEFRRAAPAPLAPKPFNIVTPFETKLSNDLKVVIVEDNRLPIISLRLALTLGDAHDAADERGVTSAMTHLLTQGTTNRTSKQIAEDIERLGASISASSSSDNTVIGASVLTAYRTEILNLLAEIVLQPSFPENELALYRQNAIEGIKVQRSNAGFLADEQISRIIFGAHPYSFVAPTVSDIENITREKLVEFHRQRIVPGAATFIVVGDVKRDEIVAELEKLFGAWQGSAVPPAKFETPPARTEKTLTVVDRPGSAQSNIVLSNLAIERTNPDYFPFLLMNQILGAGASSRLFMNLREDKGYTYGAYSSIDARRFAGAFETTAEVRTAVTGDALKEFFYELNRLRDEDVAETELQDAKNFLTGVFPIRAETQEGLTNLIVSQQLYNLPGDYLQTYRDNINRVTLDDVRRAAQTYVTPDRIAIVVVGDAEEILPQARGYAERIEIFDTEGKPRDITDYGKSAAAPSADISGSWKLELEAMGQKLPVTLELKQDGGKVSGTLKSMLGDGAIENGKISGDSFSGTAISEMQGQKVELVLAGTIAGEKMSGTVTVPMLPEPLSFAGNREK